MATRTATTTKTQLHADALVIEWAGLLVDDDGDWRLLGHYNDKCVHVYGTWGGATATIQGSNEDTPTSTPGLTDPTQTTISLTDDGIKQILENPLNIRPKITGGDGSTSLKVRLVCRT